MTSSKRDEFKARFEHLLGLKRVAEKARPYYFRHLERWGAAFRERAFGVSRHDFLEGYFKKLIHTDGVEPFVANQALDAIRLAHEVLLKEEWTADVDWEGLRVVDPNGLVVPGEAVAEQRSHSRKRFLKLDLCSALP